VGDHQDPAAVPVCGQLVQEGIGGGEDLPVALTAGEGLVDAPGPLGGQEGDRAAVELAVVALAQPGILVDRDLSVRERDLGRLHGAVQIGDEYHCDAVIAAALPEFAGLCAPLVREPAREPAGRDARLVIGGGGVRLVDDPYCHVLSLWR